MTGALEFLLEKSYLVGLYLSIRIASVMGIKYSIDLYQTALLG